MTAPTGGPTEPASDIRQMASIWWQTYVALTTEGFNPDQAIHLLGITITAGIHGNSGSNDT